MTTQTLGLDTWRTPAGNRITMAYRPGTSDWNTVQACSAVGDEYHLPTGLTGWALDVGAHIGACTVPLLVDNPDLRCIAIEALPENVELLRANLERNGVASRCIVIEGAAGDGSSQRIGYGEVTDRTLIHEYIGNANAPEGSRDVTAEGVSLSDVLVITRAGGATEPIVWAKLDCEGCEYPFLDTELVGTIAHIEGEVHFGWDRLVDILSPTHVVSGAGEDFGPFTAVRR